MKYILVTGGSVSGIGKGIVTSSIGALLKACRLRVTAIKIDPYINIDAGTFSPYEHGEVFVLDDGCEVDLDLGNYERFLNVKLCAANNITTGKIYDQVIKKERQGEYLGKTVQIIPHITDAIQQWIESTALGPSDDPKEQPEICVIELGGTIGDIESMPFIEALRQLQRRVKRDNFCCCHVNLVPCVGPSRELKTKPTQSSVKTLKSLGINPDMIVCRSERNIGDNIRDKISNFCDVEAHRVFNLPDLETVYKVPTFLEEQHIIKAISECLQINICTCDRLRRWEVISHIATSPRNRVQIGLVGKYTALGDCYTSVVKALEHASYHLGVRPKITYIDSELLESETEDEKGQEAWRKLETSDCVIVPGGFGTRGVQGKIRAIRYAREAKLPFLGVCLGFQSAVVEYAKNVLYLYNACSAEFEEDILERGETPERIVIEMLEYLDPDRKLGGTMRLGLRKTEFVVDDCLLKKLYGGHSSIMERHRHRYEINPEYIDELEKMGLKFVGKNEDGTRMEIFELEESVHPYFVGVQYHPEYLSRPFHPSPPYLGLIQAGLKKQGFEAVVDEDSASLSKLSDAGY